MLLDRLKSVCFEDAIEDTALSLPSELANDADRCRASCFSTDTLDEWVEVGADEVGQRRPRLELESELATDGE